MRSSTNPEYENYIPLSFLNFLFSHTGAAAEKSYVQVGIYHALCKYNSLNTLLCISYLFTRLGNAAIVIYHSVIA